MLLRHCVGTIAIVLIAALSALLATTQQVLAEEAAQSPRAKNVIIMVADGAGFNAFRATSMYRGRLGQEVYDQSGWLLLGCTTYPLVTNGSPQKQNRQNEKLVYTPERAWDSENGYAWLRSTATDSAAAGTALATGIKTYNNAINYDDLAQKLEGRTLPEIAHKLGKSAGVVTSVQWSHATPAALGGAHNIDRDNYEQIADEMLKAPYLQVIMGAGHPRFDSNGRERSGELTNKDYRYVGGDKNWEALVSGQHPGGWTMIQTKSEFEKLTEGRTPEKVLGIAQVSSTLQQGRRDAGGNEPFQTPFIENVPSLAVMTAGALNVLDNNPQGFYLMVEGGAVDWANHANQLHRMIEEQCEFLAAVETVVSWIEKNSSWDETLLIITADHECGLLWGPESESKPFDPIQDQGPGKMPAAKYNATNHTNSLVPLYARGPGAELFRKLIRGKDAKAAEVWSFSGEYVDNTDVFRVANAVLTGQTLAP